MVDSLRLLAGSPLPVPELSVEIHQPTLREVALLGEKELYQVYSLLTLTSEKYMKMVEAKAEGDKEMIEAVKNKLMFMDDFQLVLETALQDGALNSNLIGFLYIIFPKAKKITVEKNFLIISWLNSDKKELLMTNKEFQHFVPVIDRMFNTGNSNKEAFNPINDKAAEIAAKIEARRKRLAKEKGEDKEEKSALATGISVLATVDGMSLDTILNYTIPQLYYQLERSRKYSEYQTQITLGAFAGLKDVEIADWTHSI